MQKVVLFLLLFTFYSASQNKFDQSEVLRVSKKNNIEVWVYNELSLVQYFAKVSIVMIKNNSFYIANKNVILGVFPKNNYSVIFSKNNSEKENK